MLSRAAPGLHTLFEFNSFALGVVTVSANKVSAAVAESQQDWDPITAPN